MPRALVDEKVLLFTELNGRAASARRRKGVVVHGAERTCRERSWSDDRVCAAVKLGAILAATRLKPAALPGPAQGKVFLFYFFLGLFYLCVSVCCEALSSEVVIE